MKDWFDNYSELLIEADSLRQKNDIADGERVLIQAFYNGESVTSDEEAADQGIDQNINHLFGWNSMSKASGRVESPKDQPIIWNLEFPIIPPEMREGIESEVTKMLNQIIRDSDKMTQPIRSFAGEVTLQGRACLAHTDITTWYPKFIDPLVPHGTLATRDDLPYFIVPMMLSRYQLEEGLRKSEKPGSNWNGDSCRQAIAAIKSATVSGATASSSLGNSTTRAEEQSAKQQTTDVPTMRRLKLPVYMCYISNPSDEGNPWDLVIVPRYSQGQREFIMKTRNEKGSVDDWLYHGKKIFKNVGQVIHELFLETNLGGELYWHSAIGMGRLSFESDQDIEDGFNAMLTSIKEAMKRMYVVSPGSDREQLQRFLSETSNLIPEGVTIAEMGSGPNYQHIMTAINMLSNHSRKLSASATGNQDTFDDELQVQAMERQQEQQEMLSRRMSSVYAFYKKLGDEVVRRFFAAPVVKGCDGYYEVMEFRQRLKDLVGQETFALLSKEAEGQLVNVRVRPNKAAGDGDSMKALAGNRFLLSQAHRFNADAQQEILRSAVITETGDADKAERLVPRQPGTDGVQEAIAMAENGNARAFGFTGNTMPLNKGDIHVRQIPVHLQYLAGIVAKGGMVGWEDDDYAEFMAVGSHTAIHIQTVAQIPEQKELAMSYQAELQKISREGQEFANNMQAKRAGQEVNPVDQEKLAMDRERLELDKRKQLALEHQRNVTQEHRERDLAFRQESTAEQIVNQAESQRRQSELSSVALAEKITKPEKPKAT